MSSRIRYSWFSVELYFSINHNSDVTALLQKLHHEEKGRFAEVLYFVGVPDGI